MNPDAGMLRLVFGLGTRAVNRVSGDYARIVPLDFPEKGPPVKYGDEIKFSQHKTDVLDLHDNRLKEVPIGELTNYDLKTDKNIFFSVDTANLNRLRELGYAYDTIPQILDFKKLLTETGFTEFIRTALATLTTAYGHHIDIEFTVNFYPNSDFRFNLLQCRPLQTKGLGRTLKIPHLEKEQIFFSSAGDFMGGNVRLSFDYAVFVKIEEYLALSDRDKYQAARLIGIINKKLKDNTVLLVGPGRWGTTTPSLGVPVHFSELCNMAAICEVSYPKAGIVPELSFGSHFFQDIVESDIFYVAIFDGEKGILFVPEQILTLKNLFHQIVPGEKKWSSLIHIAETPALTLHSDITNQKLLIYWDKSKNKDSSPTNRRNIYAAR
jgi:hypothetical protein